MHSKTHSVDDSRRQYSTAFTPRQSYTPQMPTELRIIARLAFALPRMVPTDLEALRAAPGNEHLTGVHVVKLFIAHAIKWPWLVTAFFERTSAVLSVTADGLAAVARQLTDAFLDVAADATGYTMKEMFDRMNSGLASATTGIAVQGMELGVISKTPGSRLGEDDGEEVYLGPALKTYFVADKGSEAAETCTAIFSRLLTAANEVDWSWPADPDQFKAFATRAMAFACMARSLQVDGYGLKGGRSAENQYMVQHFTRALLLCNPCSGYEVYASSWCESSGGCGMAAIAFDTVLAWTPDERSHCESFGKLPCGEVERLFGVHPLLLSGWTCLAGQVPADGQAKILGASDAAIRAVLDVDEAFQKGLPIGRRFNMGMRALALALGMPSSGAPVKRPASSSGDGRKTTPQRNRSS